MKNARFFEMLVAILLLVGGLNWGLVGLFRWDLVSSIFGEMSPVTRVIFAAIGFAAAYRILMWAKARVR